MKAFRQMKFKVISFFACYNAFTFSSTIWKDDNFFCLPMAVSFGSCYIFVWPKKECFESILARIIKCTSLFQGDSGAEISYSPLMKTWVNLYPFNFLKVQFTVLTWRLLFRRYDTLLFLHIVLSPISDKSCQSRLRNKLEGECHLEKFLKSAEDTFFCCFTILR